MESLYGSRHSVQNAFDRAEKVNFGHRSRGLTQDTRATVDGVLDPRTILILRKFRSAGHIDELGGTISTGKEANVYSAVARVRRVDENDGVQVVCLPRAIKIFKTSILVFKNRRQYVEGEYRFRHGYTSSSNPRKMVKQWAEKEFRNLRRMYQMGLRGPVPICLRGHAFVMSMIGKDDTTPAPRLRDYPARDIREWKRLYIEVLALMRALYHDCQLVHGDLSEYNILFHAGHPYIIDVSQATDEAHCHSERFLKRDCFNVAAFFSKKCRGLFDDDAEHSEEELAEEDEDLVDCDAPVLTPFDAQDEDSEEDAADLSDNSSTDSSGLLRNTPCKVRFNTNALRPLDQDDEKFVRGASALNRWKWDAALAEKNAWNELEKHMSPALLEKLDNIEVMNVENTYQYVVAKSVREVADGHIWPVFDAEWRNLQWELVTHGQRILNNVAAVENEDREVVEDQRVLRIDYADMQTQCRKFQTLCAKTLLYVDTKRGTNSTDDTGFFVKNLAPQSLHELGTIEVERELRKIQLGQASKYAELLASTAGVVAEDSASDSDAGSEAGSASDDEKDDSNDDEEGEAKFDGNIPAGVDPKEWKKKVKAENRERRLHKLKKKEKKLKIKRSKKR